MAFFFFNWYGFHIEKELTKERNIQWYLNIWSSETAILFGSHMSFIETVKDLKGGPYKIV